MQELESELSPLLTYHNPKHTLYVLQSCEEIANHEAELSWQDLILLQVAALYHDSGFMRSYQDHEYESVNIAGEQLPKFGFNVAQIESISQIIMATRREKEPESLLEQILCDADLYYLGTSNFAKGAASLFTELKNFDLIKNEEEWNYVQIKFLSEHQYYTNYCKLKREPVKQKHLQELINKA